ncbi:MAG: hypothetical protein LBJ09_03730 [Clostridiales bacterium]|jgi:hypothetical protein|nr:hypothetical protein [Clostridiales bacterium]
MSGTESYLSEDVLKQNVLDPSTLNYEIARILGDDWDKEMPNLWYINVTFGVFAGTSRICFLTENFEEIMWIFSTYSPQEKQFERVLVDFKSEEMIKNLVEHFDENYFELELPSDLERSMKKDLTGDSGIDSNVPRKFTPSSMRPLQK